MRARATTSCFATGSVRFNGYRINGLEPVGADTIDSIEEQIAVLGLTWWVVVGVVGGGGAWRAWWEVVVGVVVGGGGHGGRGGLGD